MRRMVLGLTPPGAASRSWVVLRELCGEDEEAVAGTDTAEAIRLLDRLLSETEGAALGPGEAKHLTAADRDRLLANVYAAEFGPKIDCILRCTACAAPFDIDFRLPDLLGSLGMSLTEPPSAQAPTLELADGRRVRVPCGEDELVLLGLPPDRAESALLERCMIHGAAEPGDPAVTEALERAAPILDLDLDATCPECGAPVQAHFDLQRYVLAAIMQETAIRLGEIHLLASSYGWSLREILQLRRRQRRAFALAIERDRGANAVLA